MGTGGNRKQEGSTTNRYECSFGMENTAAVGKRGKGAEGENGIGGGGEGFAGANRESTPYGDRAVTVLSSLSRCPNSASKSSHLASNSSSSSQISSLASRHCIVDKLGLRGELFCVSTSKSSQFSLVVVGIRHLG